MIPRDRDFIKTKENLLFCIVGYLHPPDKYTAYLKYIPSKRGKWGSSQRYRRILKYYHAIKVYETIDFLSKYYPHYVHYCPVRKIKMSMVPKDMVTRYYNSQERLAEIINSDERDKLEEEVKGLVERLEEISGLSPENFGVTGSILTGIHNPHFSDIDLTVYGIKESLLLKEVLIELKDDPLIRRLTLPKLKEMARKISRHFDISWNDAWNIACRRWNYGYFGERYFSIHPVRKYEEITYRYGDEVYEPLGVIEGEANVSDASESLFLPAIYRIEDVHTNRDVSDLRMIVSFEGLFSGICDEGEKIRFKGKLEKVLTRDGSAYHRVVIGSAEVPDNYLVPVV